MRLPPRNVKPEKRPKSFQIPPGMKLVTHVEDDAPPPPRTMRLVVAMGPYRRIVDAKLWQRGRMTTMLFVLSCGHEAPIFEQVKNEHGVGLNYAACPECRRKKWAEERR